MHFPYMLKNFLLIPLIFSSLLYASQSMDEFMQNEYRHFERLTKPLDRSPFSCQANFSNLPTLQTKNLNTLSRSTAALDFTEFLNDIDNPSRYIKPLKKANMSLNFTNRIVGGNIVKPTDRDLINSCQKLNEDHRKNFSNNHFENIYESKLTESLICIRLTENTLEDTYSIDDFEQVIYLDRPMYLAPLDDVIQWHNAWQKQFNSSPSIYDYCERYAMLKQWSIRNYLVLVIIPKEVVISYFKGEAATQPNTPVRLENKYLLDNIDNMKGGGAQILLYQCTKLILLGDMNILSKDAPYQYPNYLLNAQGRINELNKAVFNIVGEARLSDVDKIDVNEIIKSYIKI